MLIPVLTDCQHVVLFSKTILRGKEYYLCHGMSRKCLSLKSLEKVIITYYLSRVSIGGDIFFFLLVVHCIYLSCVSTESIDVCLGAPIPKSIWIGQRKKNLCRMLRVKYSVSRVVGDLSPATSLCKPMTPTLQCKLGSSQHCARLGAHSYPQRTLLLLS